MLESRSNSAIGVRPRYHEARTASGAQARLPAPTTMSAASASVSAEVSGNRRSRASDARRARHSRRARSASWRPRGPSCRRCRSWGLSSDCSQASRIGSIQRQATSSSSRRMNSVRLPLIDVDQQSLVGVELRRLEGLGHVEPQVHRPQAHRLAGVLGQNRQRDRVVAAAARSPAGWRLPVGRAFEDRMRHVLEV